MKKFYFLLFSCTAFFANAQIPLTVIDSCFNSSAVSTSFNPSVDLTNNNADLMSWDGVTPWAGSWSNANLTLPPPTNLISCHAIFCGSGTVWTTGGEGFGILISPALVAGQTYSFTITYVSNGFGSNGAFSPELYSSPTGAVPSGTLIMNLPPAGNTWVTNTITFTATAAQNGDTWLVIFTNSGGSSGMINSFCSACNVATCTLNLGPDTAICTGQTVTINATTAGATAYLWSTGATTATINVNTAGTYWAQVTTASCTASDTVIVVIGGSVTTNINTTICPSSVYTLPDGTIVSAAGIYRDTLLAGGGCDSIIVTNLMLYPIYSNSVNASICQGQTYILPDGSSVGTAGTYIDTLPTIHGCDSVITTNLAVNSTLSATVNASICQGQTYTLPSGNIVSATGIYVDTTVSGGGCDSITTTNLTINPSYSNAVNANICQGQNYTLPDGTVTNTSGTYIDTLTTVNGCDSIITTNLTVTPAYAFTINAAICPQDVYTLPDGTITGTPGTYIDTLHSAAGCDSIITVNVSFNVAVLTASNDTAICVGSSVQLSSTIGFFTYVWSPSDSLSNPFLPNPVANPTQTTSYIIMVQMPSGNLITNGDFGAGNVGFSCDYTYQTNLVPEGTYYVGTNPNTYHAGFSACTDHTTGTGNMMIVNGAGTAGLNVWCETITIVPNTNYAFSCWVTTVSVAGSPALLQFSINGGLIGPVFSAPLTVCPWQQFFAVWNSGANTTANICIVNQNTILGGNDFALDDISFATLCTEYDTVTITVHQPTTTNVNALICQGSTYTFPDGTTSTVSSIDTALLFDQIGCDSTVITNLTVHQNFTVDLLDTICHGISFTLPSGISVNTTGNYTDSLVTVFGCDSILITHLFVIPPPLTDVFDTICSNQTYTLPSGNTVSATGLYLDSLTTLSGCDSVVITHLTVNPVTQSAVNDTICFGSTFTLPDGSMVIASGIYPVTLVNQYECDSVVTTTLVVINITMSSSGTDELCNGDSAGTITSSSNNGLLPYNYILSQGVSVLANNATGNFNNLIAGSYTVSVTDNFGCSTSNNIILNQPPPLQISDTVIEVRCFGESNGEILISASGGAPVYTYVLNNQTTNQNGTFTQLSTGNYGYMVTDANGCSDTSSAAITQPQEIVITITPDPVVMNLGENIQLNATTNYDPNATYLWNPSFGLSCYTCPNPVVETYNSLVYDLSVTVDMGGYDCNAETTIPVTVIPNYNLFIPNVFTPNGDGNNDFFQIYGNLTALKQLDVQIFDRIGEKVFESNDLYFKWDGTYKGKPFPESVLVYQIYAVFLDNHAEKLFKGSLTLLR